MNNINKNLMKLSVFSLMLLVGTASAAGPVWTANPGWDTPSIGGNELVSPTLADLDNDGDLDLLMSDPYSSVCLGYENTGNAASPTWNRKSEWDVVTGLSYSPTPTLGDLDGDGDYDLMLSYWNLYKIIAYENTGNAASPTWTRNTAWDTPDLGSMESNPALADLDDDGDLDLLIGLDGWGDPLSGFSYAYENTGSTSSPTWTRKSEWDVPDVGEYATPTFADLDGDGDYDLLIGESSGICYAYENTGSASSPTWTANPSWDVPDVGQYVDPVLADLDNDGDYDLLIGEQGTGVSLGYKNTAPTGAKPDLIPTAITPPSSIIANIPSTIGAAINNSGTGDAAAFDVTLSANGTVVDTQTVSGITSGSSAAVSFSWTPAAAGDYSLTVTADSGDAIIESDETNNELSQVVTVVSTGYMGGTLTSYAHDVVRGDLLYSTGNSIYRSSLPSGETYTVEFNITDIPAGAAVKTARLYSYWCYSSEEPGASMDVTFDSTLQTTDASYTDRKGYGSYDKPYGTYAYNVDLAGNGEYTATITNTGNTFSIYAMGLLVVYEDGGNEVEYWIDEGADLIYSKDGITPAQATTDAPFDGTVTLGDVGSARLITVVPSGDKGNNTLLFNTYTESGIWNTPNIAVEERDVSSDIISTGNLAQLRDDNADYMMPSGAFLVMQRFYVPPPVSSGVSLGATILPAISIDVTPGTVDFGTLAPGQASSEQTLSISNTGGCNVSVTADATDTAGDLYARGLMLDSGIWSSYSAAVEKSAAVDAGAVLDVPDDYAGVGPKEGTLVFWAQKS